MRSRSEQEKVEKNLRLFDKLDFEVLGNRGTGSFWESFKKMCDGC
jgi:hypothetical protein